MGRFDGGLHADRIRGVDQQDVDALLQHVFHVTDLLGHVVAGIGDDQLRTDGRRRFLQGVFHGDEVRVVDFLEGSADAHGGRLGVGQGDGGDA